MGELLLPGTMVRSHVCVMGERVPMHVGIVVHDYGDSVDVDRMSLHGGAPWVVREDKRNLTIEGAPDASP